MTDQPINNEPHLMRILSSLSRPFTTAKYAGVNTMQTKMKIATACFIAIKMFISINIYLPYVASFPNSSSIRISWLYFAILSVLDIEPVLICPAFVATAKSAIVVSSVSPLR